MTFRSVSILYDVLQLGAVSTNYKPAFQADVLPAVFCSESPNFARGAGRSRTG